MAERVARRLAAILALDVVGYSRMMGADETGTLARLKADRAGVFEPAIRENGGEIVKFTGDGLLALFGSAVDAVNAAASIQQAMETRAEETDAMRVRIGVNLGDVIIEDGDIYGDGVNIAARLEGLAPAGGVLVSASVLDAVRNKAPCDFEPMGEQRLKNIDHPVSVFRAVPAGTAAAPPRRRRALIAVIAALALVSAVGAGWMLNRPPPAPPAAETPAAQVARAKPTIAVLPLDNFSGDPAQDYFSDGLTEDLITDISKISGVQVIARNSTSSYKGQSPDIREVGAALGATHVIEGSVRRAGDTVRITVQLIDAADGRHVWAERYDRELRDVFAIQDEVIGHIVKALSLTLTTDETDRIARRGTDSLEAYDLFLRGLRRESFFTREDNKEAERLYLEALAIEPDYAEVHAHLAQVYSLAVELGWADDPEALERKALETAQKATELDPSLPYAFWSLGRIYTRFYLRDNDRAKVAFRRAVTLNPNFADGYVFLAFTEIYSGDAAKAFALIEKAMALNPHYPFWYLQGLGGAYLMLGDTARAVEHLEQAVDRNPNVPWVRRWLIAAYGAAGMTDEAEWQILEMESLGQEATIGAFMRITPISDHAYRDRFEAALRAAGMPD